jgi:5,5'-dehydrodivanillate O-demethylase
VLWKDKSGNVGLIQDHCAHRGASLMYGRVEERGISCAYHGWLFNTAGDCLECPAEPAGSLFHLTVKMRAYPVQAFIGIYWAYLGPLPAPAISKYDLWARPDGSRRLYRQPMLDCNWLQPMENSVDPAHLQILHQDSIGNRARAHLAGVTMPRRVAPSTTRGFTDDVDYFDFFEVPYGIMKRRVFKDGRVDEHPLIFPNILRVGNATQIRVPVDDTHTQVFIVHFDPTDDGSIPVEQGDPPTVEIEPYKTPVAALHPHTHFRMDETQAQDHMAWETQGPIADRTVERLATTDRGVVMLREILQREMERVANGEDP